MPSSSAKCFQSLLIFREPVGVFVCETKALRDCCKLPLGTTKEETEGDCEAKLAAANEISADAAVAAVLSEPGGVFASKKNKGFLKAFVARI